MRFFIIVGIFLFWNLVTFSFCGADKAKAKHGKWRIPEKTLLWQAALFGALGTWCGMRVFHHKTKHPRFQYGVPTMLIVQLLLLGWFFAKYKTWI